MDANNFQVRKEQLLQDTMDEARRNTPDAVQAAVQMPALEETFPELHAVDVVDLVETVVQRSSHWHYIADQIGGRYGRLGIWFTDDYGLGRMGNNPSY